MAAAETGDDVYGEDPTVSQLEKLAASMTGKDAALFVTSGTQGNLLALLSHCERGDEYIAGNSAHTYRFEAGGGAVLGGIQPQPIPFNERGELEIEAIRGAIKPDDFHFANTKLVCLENTNAGKVLELDYLSEFSGFAQSLCET
jgi:threonine aldolase